MIIDTQFNFVTGNPKLMRKINKKLVLDLIGRYSPISRTKIASKLKLALPTVVRMVDILMEDGLVIETGKFDSSGGRKPIMLEIKNNSMYVIGVEICRITTVIIMDLGGNIVAKAEEETKASLGPEVIVEQVVTMIKRLIAENKFLEDKIKGIGAGTPGTNFKSGEFIESSVFKGWENVDIKALFEAQLDYMFIIDNLSKMLAMGELILGMGKEVSNFINVFCDYGIGSGIVINGELYRGNKNVSGEFGHMVVNFKGEKCYCGNHGCLEAFTSIPAIIKMLVNEVKKNKYTCISNEVKKYGKQIDFRYVVDAQNQGDVLVTNILKKCGSIMGIGVANLINIYNPDMVIMGGEISKTCPVYLDAVKKTAFENIFSYSAIDTIITVSNLGNLAGAMGAASIVLSKIFS